MALECGSCNLRVAEGKCGVCKAPVCATCGIPCDQCGAMSCSTHTNWMKAGRALCARCARGQVAKPPASQTDQPRTHGPNTTANPQSPASEPNAAGSLSFQALQEEMGPPPAPESTPESTRKPTGGPSRATPTPAHEGAAEPGAPVHSTGAGYTKGLTAGAAGPNPHRVLTASGQQSTPTWLTGLFAAGIAWVLLFPLIRSAENVFQQAQPWMSYGIAVLGAATGLWCLAGLLSRDGERNERILCALGMLLGVAAGLIALAARGAGGPA